MTITGGGGSQTRTDGIGGGGILNEGELVLRDSIVRANTVVTGVGGGIYSASSKPLKIRGSDVSGNKATDGGGIYIRGEDVEIEDTTVSRNRSTRNGGGIVHHGGETLRLERCDITDNQAGMDVGGVLTLVPSWCLSTRPWPGIAPSTPVVSPVGARCCRSCAAPSGATSAAAAAGGSVLAPAVSSSSTARWRRINHEAPTEAGIFASSLSGDVSLRNSTVTGNTAAQDGGGISNDSAEIDLDNSKVIDNQAGRNGGGIYSRIFRKGLVKLTQRERHRWQPARPVFPGEAEVLSEA